MGILHGITGCFSGLCLDQFFNLGRMIHNACSHSYSNSLFNRCTATIIAAAILFTIDAIGLNDWLRKMFAGKQSTQAKHYDLSHPSIADVLTAHPMPGEEGYYPGIEQEYNDYDWACWEEKQKEAMEILKTDSSDRNPR